MFFAVSYDFLIHFVKEGQSNEEPESAVGRLEEYRLQVFLHSAYDYGSV